MTVSVLVEQTNGQFSAMVVGAPQLRCVRPSREEAISALQRQLTEKFSSGELIDLQVPAEGIFALAGKYKDDPDLRGICDQIYQDRDADPHR